MKLPGGAKRRTEAFSLIELIGVLTIIVLLATAAAPTFIKRIDHETINAERENLKRFSEALLRACLRDRIIRTAADWPQRIAGTLDSNPSQVSTNGRRFARVFLAHPGLSLNGSPLPYTQTSGLVSPPVNARGLILSTIAVPLPDLSGLTVSEFTNIWHTADGIKPTALSAWGGRGADLVVERIEFGPLFYNVLLVNVDPLPDVIPNRGYFSFNSYPATWVVPQGLVDTYLMEGTVLNFFRANGTSLDLSEILRTDTSFTYKKNRWGRRLGGSDDVIGEFGNLISEFLDPPAPADPKFAATQQSVVNEFYSFLWEFTAWANGDPSTNYTYAGTPITPAVPKFAGGGGPGAPNYPTYSRVAEAQVNLATFTDNIIH